MNTEIISGAGRYTTTIEYQPGDPEYEGPHLFDPGDLRITSNARVMLHKHGKTWQEYLDRHCSGDCGDYEDELEALYQAQSIDLARPVESNYHIADRDWLKIVTNAERTLTRMSRDWEPVTDGIMETFTEAVREDRELPRRI